MRQTLARAKRSQAFLPSCSLVGITQDQAGRALAADLVCILGRRSGRARKV